MTLALIARHLCHKRRRHPPQITDHALWFYLRFPLSPRLVEEMALRRGVVASYETIRRRAPKFGTDRAARFASLHFATRLHRPKSGVKDKMRPSMLNGPL
jgi:transposase-like protein